MYKVLLKPTQHWKRIQKNNLDWHFSNIIKYNVHTRTMRSPCVFCTNFSIFFIAHTFLREKAAEIYSHNIFILRTRGKKSSRNVKAHVFHFARIMLQRHFIAASGLSSTWRIFLCADLQVQWRNNSPQFYGMHVSHAWGCPIFESNTPVLPARLSK